MRISKISVKKLFGVFDHEIPLNQDSRITIIHGPNGVGKTIMLQMVHGLFHYDYELLERIPFEQFRLEFETDEILTVDRGANDGEAENDKSLRITICDGSDNGQKPFGISADESRAWKAAIDEARPGLKTVHITRAASAWERYWVSEDATDEASTGTSYRVYTKERLMREYPSIHKKVFGDMPQWFADIQKESDSILISTGRLKRYPMNIELVLAMSFLEHTKEDNSYVFPNPFDAVTDVRFYGLREAEFGRLRETDESVSLFLGAVNNLLQNKEVKYVKRGELKIFSHDGQEVKLETLSTGEQHLLILYHQLLFTVNPDTLVMIDEPELSMHVDWQEQFLKDMQRIVALRNFDLLIATHSPDIISDKHEWMVELGEAVPA